MEGTLVIRLICMNTKLTITIVTITDLTSKIWIS